MKKSILILSFIVLTFFLMLISENIIKYSVESKKCVGCTLCIKKCPVKAIKMEKGKAVINLEKCTGCGKCFSACPTKAITKKILPDSLANNQDSLNINSEDKKAKVDSTTK